MKCSGARKLLVAYNDGELQGAARDDLESHLSACPSCADERSAVAQLIDEILLHKAPAVPANLAQATVALAQAEVVSGGKPAGLGEILYAAWRKSSWQMRLAGSALALLLAVAGGSLGQDLVPEPQVPGLGAGETDSLAELFASSFDPLEQSVGMRPIGAVFLTAEVVQ